MYLYMHLYLYLYSDLYLYLYFYFYLYLYLYLCLDMVTRWISMTLHCFLYLKAERLYKGKAPQLTDKWHPLYNIKLPKALPSQLTHKDLTQPEAKVFMPPGSYLWRSVKHGSWEAHCPPHRRFSEPWARYAGSSYEAMHVCIRRAWILYLADFGLFESHCPIEGIF